MTASSSLTGLWPRCGTATIITSIELTVLASLTDAAKPPLSGDLACELSAGHDDQHTAFVAASPSGDPWWIRWDTRQRELVQADFCDRTDGQDDCLLPKEHPGRHSFDFEF